MKEICECKEPPYYISEIFAYILIAFLLVLTTGAITWPVVILAYLTVYKILSLSLPDYAKASTAILWILFGITIVWWYFLGTLVIL